MLKELALNSGNAISINYVPLADLEDTFLTGNSKKHDTGKIIESIQRYGFRDPITFDPVLNDGIGGIIEGNGRLESLIEMRDRNMNLPRGVKEGWKVPILFGVNSTTEEEAIAYSIEHNWSVLWGSDTELENILSLFDEEALTEQLKVLDRENSLPISVAEDLEELLETLDFREGYGEGGTEKEYDEIEEDEIPDPEDVETRVKAGDIWQLGKHRLYCGDSTNEEKIKEFLGDRTPTFIWSDPPYGIEIVSSKGAVGGVNAIEPQSENVLPKKNKDLEAPTLPSLLAAKKIMLDPLSVDLTLLKQMNIFR